MNSLSLLDTDLWGLPVLTVDMWSSRCGAFFHGFFSRELDIKNGCQEFNQLSSAHGGPTLIRLQQVHGADWVEVTHCRASDCLPSFKLVRVDGSSRDIKSWEDVEADGWIAELSVLSRFNLALGIATADCVPVLGYCKSSGLAFALHCGWRSAVADILPKALRRVCDLGASIGDVEIAIGPGASVDSYEVGTEVADSIMLATGRAAERDPNIVSPHTVKIASSNQSKAFVDIPSLLEFQAMTMGVPCNGIARFVGCTIRDDRFFSHRREAQLAGRQLSFIGPSL